MEGSIESNFLAAYEYCSKCKSLDPDAVQDIAEEMWQKVLSDPERFEEFDARRFTGYLYRCCWYKAYHNRLAEEKRNKLFVSVNTLLNDNGEYEEPVPQYWFDELEYERMQDLSQRIIRATSTLTKSECRLFSCMVWGMSILKSSQYLKLEYRGQRRIHKHLMAKIMKALETEQIPETFSN